MSQALFCSHTKAQVKLPFLREAPFIWKDSTPPLWIQDFTHKGTSITTTLLTGRTKKSGCWHFHCVNTLTCTSCLVLFVSWKIVIDKWSWPFLLRLQTRHMRAGFWRLWGIPTRNFAYVAKNHSMHMDWTVFLAGAASQLRDSSSGCSPPSFSGDHKKLPITQRRVGK